MMAKLQCELNQCRSQLQEKQNSVVTESSVVSSVCTCTCVCVCVCVCVYVCTCVRVYVCTC